MRTTPGRLPGKSRGVFSDLRSYILAKPTIPTLIEFPTTAERDDYHQRILQRLSIHVDHYSVLNIHRIGIDAPVKDVFDEALSKDMEARCWPDHLVMQSRPGGGFEEIHVVLLGGMHRLLAVARLFLGEGFGTLFTMTLVKEQRQPIVSDFDNARFLLYECGGGYPVGIFGIYVRSPVAERGERESSQLFFAVGFDFYGKRTWPGFRFVNRMWESLHNRVTANVLNRFKRLCEARLEEERRTFAAAPELEDRRGSPREPVVT